MIQITPYWAVLGGRFLVLEIDVSVVSDKGT